MTITQSSTRLVAVAAGVAVALALMLGASMPVRAAALSQTQIQSILNLLTSFGADSATLNNVSAALNGTAMSGGSTGGSMMSGGVCPFTWSRSLTTGSKGADVMALQKFLNMDSGTMVSASGAGSAGMETSTFGPATKKAVMKFQAKYGISKVGNIGPMTRAKLNSLCTSGTSMTPTPSPTPGTPSPTPGTPGTTGGSVTVSAAAQPANSLAVAGAARVPFTTFTLMNNGSTMATISGVTVQRTGLGIDSNFSGVVLLDSTGVQIGNSKTFNSNHQAVIGDTFTLNPGQSMTYTVAGNMAAAATAQAGQIVALQVVAINSTATISGSFPIVGASNTINNTLTLGSISTSTSAFSPGIGQTKNIGDTGVKFTAVRFTAGSVEDLKLMSIRWRQVGSASGSDLSNIMSVVNGTTYPATVDVTGKYYTTTFPSGLLIAKGNSIDAYVVGDITGSNASGRNIDFDIDRSTDVYFVGQLYNYGVADTLYPNAQPWLNGYVVTVAGGTATTIAKATEVAAQNIAVNVTGQPLGGFVTDFKGEPVTVQGMIFNVSTSTGVAMLTNVSITDANGVVVAGPVDQVGTKLTFSDSVTFPVGRKVYTLKGKVGSGSTNGGTVVLDTTPSTWTNPTGQSSSNTVAITQGNFALNTMTVKAASLAVAISATPAAQNIVAGSQGVTFANVQLDATQSGEDLRISSIALTENGSTNANAGLASKLSSCQLYDGTTALNGGSNVVNPSGTASTSVATTFTLDNSITLPKGTVKVLTLKCNVSSGADSMSTFQFGITSAQVAALAATGVNSGSSVVAGGATNNGQLMTVSGSGSVVASIDSSSPSYTIAAANQTGVTLGVIKLRATNETVNLNRIGLKLTNSASSSASDLTQVYLYQGATLLGSATFVGSNTNATSSLLSPLVLTRDTDTAITIKGDIANMGTSQPATAGHLIAVDVDTAGTNTQGVGSQSGGTVNATGSTAVSGVRIFKSYPILAKDTVPTNTLSNGTQTLLRFKVTAALQGDVGVGKVTLQISTTTAIVTSVNVYAFTDASYSTPVAGLRSDGALLASNLATVPNAAPIAVVASTPVQVPAGLTRYFAVMATVSGAATNTTVQTQLQGDAAYPAISGFVDTLANINAGTNNNFIWSPNTTGTAASTDAQWTNGFGLIGLPSSNMGAEVLSK